MPRLFLRGLVCCRVGLGSFRGLKLARLWCWSSRLGGMSASNSNRADLSKDPHAVSGMFNEVAPAYDRTNTLLSFGLDSLWRQATARAVAPRSGELILDLAAGTGVSSQVLARSGAEIVAGDFSVGMIAEGKRRRGHIRNLRFQHADAMHLPFEDNTFDAVTISFGLRNVQDTKRAMREMLRVTKPGGRLVICEFSQPDSPTFAKLYRFYNNQVLPNVARVLSSNGAAYEYLNESISTWPDAAPLRSWLSDSGWVDVASRKLTGGIVALHRARKASQISGADSAVEASS